MLVKHYILGALTPILSELSLCLLLVKHYILGALTPGLVMGIMPMVLALMTGNLFVFAFGMFFTLAAGGDFMMVNLLRKDFNVLVQDHPSKIGCYLYTPV